ncbi:hypothetical protein BCC1697_006383 [Burkholderia gladioli]
MVKGFHEIDAGAAGMFRCIYVFEPLTANCFLLVDAWRCDVMRK